MVNIPSKKVALVASIALSAIFLYFAVNAIQIMGSKTHAQQAVTESMERWKSSYLALAESRAKWDKVFQLEPSDGDMSSFYERIGLNAYGLNSDKDSLVFTKIEQVTINDAPIGLTRMCMSNGSADGSSLVVQAKDYESLLIGIENLVKRQDIYIGSITIRGDRDIPIAKLGDFCIMMRND